MDASNLTSEVTTFLDRLAAWAAVALPGFISAILVLIVGWWLAGRAQRGVRVLIERRVDPTLVGVISTTVRYAILVVVFVVVLGQAGIQTTSILAALGAAGLAIGLAMQGTLSNIAAGAMLLWLRPFSVGDYIETASAAGTVTDVGLFASELHSWDGIYQFVPNAQLWNTRIVNHSRLPTRLVDLAFGVSYGDDIDEGRKVLLEMAHEDPRVLKAPAPPLFFVGELGNSAVVLALRVWVANAEYWNVRRDFTEWGKLRLEQAGLTIPFPQRDVRVIPADSPEPVRKLA